MFFLHIHWSSWKICSSATFCLSRTKEGRQHNSIGKLEHTKLRAKVDKKENHCNLRILG